MLPDSITAILTTSHSCLRYPTNTPPKWTLSMGGAVITLRVIQVPNGDPGLEKRLQTRRFKTR